MPWWKLLTFLGLFLNLVGGLFLNLVGVWLFFSTSYPDASEQVVHLAFGKVPTQIKTSFDWKDFGTL